MRQSQPCSNRYSGVNDTRVSVAAGLMLAIYVLLLIDQFVEIQCEDADNIQGEQ